MECSEDWEHLALPSSVNDGMEDAAVALTGGGGGSSVLLLFGRWRSPLSYCILLSQINMHLSLLHSLPTAVFLFFVLFT